MKKALIAMLLFSVAIACQRVPISGRRQLKLVSNAELLPLSFASYRGVLDTSRVAGGNDAAMVKEGARLINGLVGIQDGGKGQ